jgi:hypothetical protein
MDISRLGLLEAELAAIEAWDIYEPIGSDSYEPRQERRREIIAEICRLTGESVGGHCRTTDSVQKETTQVQAGRAADKRKTIRTV